MIVDAQSLIRELIDWFDRWPLNAAASRDAWRMTQAVHPYEHLFSPITINRLELKNRLIMGPMGNLAMVEPSGRPSEAMVAYFAERARGGVGLIMTGLVPTSPDIDPSVLPRDGAAWFPRINGVRSVLAGWRDLAERVHAHGAPIFIQLTAGLGRVGSPECVRARWRLPVSASWNPNFYVPPVPCRRLSDRAVRRIVRDIGQAAADAQECGLDGVHLHGHEGYLLEQFANTAFNRRRFGRYADWQALGLDAVSEIRRRCGQAYPIAYRIDLSLALRETYGDRLEREPELRRFQQERSVAMSLAYIRALVAAGVDMIDVDLGCYENWWLPHPPGPMPPGAYLRVARCVRDYLAAEAVTSGAGLPVAVAAVGKLGYPDLAEGALRDGNCDMVMLARPLLADPHWPRKAFAGRVADITPCIGDHEACLKEIVEGGHLQCAVNPRTGFETVYPADPPPAAKSKRIAVVGAGPAGITAACLAAARGHHVSLFERADRIGGWLRAGSVPAIKFDVANYLTHLERRVGQAMHMHGLVRHLSTAVTAETLRTGGFDAVICCTGSMPIRPAMAETAAIPSVLATDLLLAPALAAGAREVVVVGGGDVGCETAHLLAFEYGKQVTIVEQSCALMASTSTANRGYLLHALERQGVTLLTAARVDRISAGGVEIVRNKSPTVPAPGAVWRPILPRNIPIPFTRRPEVVEERITLRADLVVFAVGMTPDARLYHACVSTQVADEICNIGDSFQVGAVAAATRAGYVTALAL
ncbi:MAG: FAD-dependent oxidoreductase [Acetobacteraceae bacterium]